MLRHYLTYDEAMQLLENIPRPCGNADDDMVQTVACIFYLGCRVSELLKIRTHDVHLDDAVPFVRIAHLKAKGKHKNTKREIPLMGTVKEIFRQRLGRLENGGRLFGTYRQKIHRAIKIAAKKAGITIDPGACSSRDGLPHAHTLRHGFAVDWIRGGGELTKLQKWLGHADPKTTSGYLRYGADDLADEYNRIQEKRRRRRRRKKGRE